MVPQKILNGTTYQAYVVPKHNTKRHNIPGLRGVTAKY